MKRKYLFTFIYDNKDCLFRDIISAKSPIEYFPSHKNIGIDLRVLLRVVYLATR